MSDNIIIDESILRNAHEYKSIVNVIDKLNLSSRDLPPEFRMKWERTFINIVPAYKVTLFEDPDGDPHHFIVWPNQIEFHSPNIKEIDREFNWTLGYFYQSRVRRLLDEIKHSTMELSGVPA